MSNQEDGLLRSSWYDGYDIPELDGAEVGEVLRPGVLLGSESESGDRLVVPARRPLRFEGSWNPGGELRRQLPVELGSRSGVE